MTIIGLIEILCNPAVREGREHMEHAENKWVTTLSQLGMYSGGGHPTMCLFLLCVFSLAFPLCVPSFFPCTLLRAQSYIIHPGEIDRRM